MATTRHRKYKIKGTGTDLFVSNDDLTGNANINDRNAGYDPISYGADNTGVADCHAVFEAILALIATDATNKTIELTTGTYKMSGNVTFPATVKIRTQPGAKFSIDDGVTLTIRGHVDFGKDQVFSGSGTASFANNVKVTEFYPEWWGAAASPSTVFTTVNDVDSKTAIQAALTAAIQVHGTVIFSAGRYYVSGQLDINGMGEQGLKVKGVGQASSVIVTDYNGKLLKIGLTNDEIEVAQYGLIIEDLCFIGPKRALEHQAESGAGTDIWNLSIGIYMNFIQQPWNLRNLTFAGFHEGFEIDTRTCQGSIENVHLVFNDIGGYFKGEDSDPIKVRNLEAYYNSTAQLYITTPRVEVSSSHFDVGVVGSAEKGIVILGTLEGNRTSIHDCTFEADGASTGSFIEIGESVKTFGISIKNNIFSNSQADMMEHAIEIKVPMELSEISGNIYSNFITHKPIKCSWVPTISGYYHIRLDEKQLTFAPILSDADQANFVFPVEPPGPAYTSLRAAANHAYEYGGAIYDQSGPFTDPIHTITTTVAPNEAISGYVFYFETTVGDGNIWEVVWELCQYGTTPMKNAILSVQDVDNGIYLCRNLISPLPTSFQAYSMRVLASNGKRLAFILDLYDDTGINFGSVAFKDPLFRKVNVYTGAMGANPVREIRQVTGTATAAQTFNIATQIPVGARIIGTKLRVDVALTSSDGGAAWTAAYNTGATQQIATGVAFAKNTKIPALFNANAATDITSALTDITITCDSSKTFIAGGKVTAAVEYEILNDLGDAP